MRIVSIELTNIKSYRELKLGFAPGVNFICGANGSGKSTIIEAIGCAVFGGVRESLSDLVTLGEQSGSIRAEFTHNGHEYTAERTISLNSAHNSWRYYRDGVLCPLDTDKERRAWFCAETGIDGNPRYHFERILGAYQGSFRYPFDETAATRTDYFDRLFGVERYKDLYRDTSGSTKELAHEIELNDRDTEMQRKLSQGVDEDVSRLALLTASREKASAELAAATSQAAELNKSLKSLSELTRLERERTAAQAALSEFDAVVKAAKAAAAKRLAAAQKRRAELDGIYPENAAASIESAKRIYEEQQRKAKGIARFISGELSPAEQRVGACKRALEDAKKAASGICPVLGGECIRAKEAGTELPQREYDEAAQTLAALTQRACSYDLAACAAVLTEVSDADSRTAQAAFAVFLADPVSGNYSEAFAEYSQVLSDAFANISDRERALAAHSASVAACDNEIAAAHKDSQKAVENSSKRAELEAEFVSLETKCAKLRASGLDTSQADVLNAEMSSCRERCGRLEQTVKSADDTIADLNTVIDKKREALGELEKCLSRQKELAAGSIVLRDLREVLRLSGPKVAAMMRGEISRSADNIYRGMVRDGSGLEFADGYALQLNDVWRGKKRVRSYHQLSGGEKMSAALAIRLALMRAYSPLSIGFFDEPTDGLDVARREALCEMLGRELTGLQQVFIISHDSSFDSITDSVIDTAQLG